MGSGDDFRQIEAVLYRYSRAMDMRQWHLMDDVFIEDATVDMGGAMFARSREQAVLLIRTAIECCSVTHHMNSNIEIDIDGDTARVTNNFRAWHRGKGQREHLVYEAMGYYADDFIHTRDGWRIRHRTERSTIELGNLEEFFADALPLFAEMAGNPENS